MLSVFIVMAILSVRLWRKHKANLRTRQAFFAQFPSSDLRMSPYRIGVVFRVTAISPEKISTVLI